MAEITTTPTWPNFATGCWLNSGQFFDEVNRYPIVQQAVEQTQVSNYARGSCTIAKQVVSRITSVPKIVRVITQFSSNFSLLPVLLLRQSLLNKSAKCIVMHTTETHKAKVTQVDSVLNGACSVD